jgi:microcystin-dependent protein
MSTTVRTYNVAPNPNDVTGAGLPTGAITMWATATAPSGWLLCDGTAVSRLTYANLFSVIGTTWGAGNGTSVYITSGSVTATNTYTLVLSGNTNIVVGTPFTINNTGNAGFDGNTFTAIAPTNSTTITFTTSVIGNILTSAFAYVTKASPTTFNVPNTAGKTVRGVNGTYTLAGTGGAESVTLTTANLAPHSHALWRGGAEASKGSVNTDWIGTPNVDTGLATGGVLYQATNTPSSGSRTQVVGQDGTGQTAVGIVNTYVGINHIIKA